MPPRVGFKFDGAGKKALKGPEIAMAKELMKCDKTFAFLDSEIG